MLDLHPAAIETRIHQHDRRVDGINRDGWRQASAPASGGTVGLGAIPGAVAAGVLVAAVARAVARVVKAPNPLATGTAA